MPSTSPPIISTVPPPAVLPADDPDAPPEAAAITSRAWCWVLVALALLAAGANMPSPLYPGYQRDLDLSDLALTTVYATYALASVPALLLLGPLGDRWSPRTVLRAGVVAGALGSVLMACADGIGGLIAGRVAYGLALGTVTGAGMAVVARRPGPSRRPSTAGAVAFLLGSAAGPAVTGVLAQYAPAPHLLPYAVVLGLLAVAFVGLGTVPPRCGTPPAAPPGPPSTRATPGRPLFVAAANGFLGWTVAGLFLGLVPGVLGGGAAAAGAVTGALLGCSALTPRLVRRLGAGRSQLVGHLLMIPALVVLTVAGSALPAVLLSGLLAGAGHGLLYGGAAATAHELAPPSRASATTAALYVAFYLGAGLPTLLIGLLTAFTVPMTTALPALTAAALVLGLLLLRPTFRLPGSSAGRSDRVGVLGRIVRVPGRGAPRPAAHRTRTRSRRGPVSRTTASRPRRPARAPRTTHRDGHVTGRAVAALRRSGSRRGSRRG